MGWVIQVHLELKEIKLEIVLYNFDGKNKDK